MIFIDQILLYDITFYDPQVVLFFRRKAGRL